MSDKTIAFFKKYLADKSGNVGMMFGISTLAILVSVGAALDYSMSSKKYQNYQNLADAGVLAAVISEETSLEELQVVVETTIRAQNDDVGTVNFEFIGDQNEGIRVTVTGEHMSVMMHMFGHDAKPIKVISEAQSARTGVHINLALVLDSTLSMQGTRIDALKEASGDLLTFLEDAAATPEAVKVSVVPFSDYVRISTAYEAAPWLNLQSTDPVTWERLDLENSIGCVEVGESQRTECEIEVREEVTFIPEWHGCMVSRPDGFHTNPEFGGRRLQGSTHSNHCNASYNTLIPMSTDLEVANAAIQDITPVGDTYMPAGLIWGWRTLDRNLPFDELVSTSETNVRDVMLLMTDGENSVSLSGTRLGFDGINHWGIWNPAEGENQAVANALTETLCADIKDSGIEIISIAYEVTDTATIDMLSNCASTGSFFYDVHSAEELKSAFADVGVAIGTGDVRLTR